MVHVQLNSDEKVLADVRSIVDEASDLRDTAIYAEIERAKTDLFKADVSEWYDNTDSGHCLLYLSCIYVVERALNEDFGYEVGDERFYAPSLSRKREALLRLHADSVTDSAHAYWSADSDEYQKTTTTMSPVSPR